MFSPAQTHPRRTGSRRMLFLMIVTSGILSALIIFIITLGLSGKGINIKLPFTGKGISIGGLTQDQVLLIMGVDMSFDTKGSQTFEGARTDTMMLVRVSPSKNTVAVVSIPRDSKVYLADNRGIDKINAAYALGGPQLAVETVEESFGVDVDHYLVVNNQAVRDFVDALGGVNVFIEKPMRYRDRTAKLNINFQPGYNDLTGKQAEEFLRFRHDALGDIGRIRRQQQFLAAVAKKVKSPDVLPRIPALISVAQKHTQTDMPGDDLVRLGMFLKDVRIENVRVATLPGHPGGRTVSYWIVDPTPAQQVLDRLILDNPGSGDITVGGDNRVRVGILYASSSAARVEDMASLLESKNFNVVCKSRHRGGSTLIIEHTARVSDETTNLLRGLDGGLEKARLIFAPVGSTFENNVCSTQEDYTVVLGEDFKESQS